MIHEKTNWSTNLTLRCLFPMRQRVRRFPRKKRGNTGKNPWGQTKIVPFAVIGQPTRKLAARDRWNDLTAPRRAQRFWFRSPTAASRS